MSDSIKKCKTCQVCKNEFQSQTKRICCSAECSKKLAVIRATKWCEEHRQYCNAYVKKWYDDNSVHAKETQRQRWNKCLDFKHRVVQRFGCKKCGYKRCDRALDFHHRDQSTKEFLIGRYHGRSIKKIKQEMRKCDILCGKCHREEHWIDYINTYPQSKSKRFANRILLKYGCRYCGYKKCAEALDFHHIDRETKSFDLWKIATSTSMLRIKAEIRKCYVVCVNCHRELDCNSQFCNHRKEGQIREE